MTISEFLKDKAIVILCNSLMFIILSIIMFVINVNLIIVIFVFVYGFSR